MPNRTGPTPLARAAARAHAQIVDEYVRRHPRSAALAAHARESLPGGDTRTVTHYEPFPVFITRGEGCRIADVDGHTYLDLLGNYTAMIWGHAHPEIVAAASAQIAQGTGFAAPTPAQLTLAEMLCARLPSVERIRFANSGTEAAMHAIRAARAFTGRDKIVKMEGGYHGSYDAVAISVQSDPVRAGPASRPVAVPEGPGIPAGVAGDVLVVPFNDPAAVEATLRAQAGEIAALIVEPVQGVAGTIPPQEGFLPFLRAITAELGIVLIFDEVISFRLDYHGAQGLFGVRPDLTVLGKIIGGGFPVGAFGGRREIMDLYDPRRPGALAQSGTFNANPVTVAAGIAGLRLLTPEAIARCNRTGETLRAGLQALFDEARLPARVTGIGSLLTVLFTDAEVVNVRAARTADRVLTAAFHLGLLLEGVFCAPRGMMATSLPMGPDEVNEALTAARRVVDRIMAAVR
ncbi:MAG: glutamate-1-semialdehyde 2,1-aminomutase [Armatimonadota bacterium]|nr:glutamate-1-semialdehyde 2,1-aminomutase [Armatimonadota bacterium]